MSGLETLRKIKFYAMCNYADNKGIIDECEDIIKKELKALEIIMREPGVCIQFPFIKSFEYNDYLAKYKYTKEEFINEEEFYILKGVLQNERTRRN